MKYYTYDDREYHYRIRIDDDANIAYISSIKGMPRPPGFNTHEHFFVDYYTIHDDVLPWNEIAIPYINVLYGRDKNHIMEEPIAFLLEIDKNRITRIDALEPYETENHLYIFVGNVIDYFSINEPIENFECIFKQFFNRKVITYAYTARNVLQFLDNKTMLKVPKVNIPEHDINLLKNINLEGARFGATKVQMVGYSKSSDRDIFTQSYSDRFIQYIYYNRNLSRYPMPIGVSPASLAISFPTQILPTNSSNAIMYNTINEGNDMVNFHDEFEHGRYYKKSVFDQFIKPTMENPFTRQRISPTNIRRYTAKFAGGKRQKSKRHNRRRF